MAIKKTIKKGFFSSINPIRWVGMGQIQNNASTIKDLIDGIFRGARNNRVVLKETFDDCIERLGLTEADIKQRMRSAKWIATICAVLSIGMCAYMLYLFFHALILGGVIAFMLMLLLWAYAFREHFNYFQMKQRRLGCTFSEWLHFIFKVSR